MNSLGWDSQRVVPQGLRSEKPILFHTQRAQIQIIFSQNFKRGQVSLIWFSIEIEAIHLHHHSLSHLNSFTQFKLQPSSSTLCWGPFPLFVVFRELKLICLAPPMTSSVMWIVKMTELALPTPTRLRVHNDTDPEPRSLWFQSSLLFIVFKSNQKLHIFPDFLHLKLAKAKILTSCQRLPTQI